MVKEIICAIDQHKLWVDSLGEKGEKVNLEEKVIEGEEWENINLSQASIVDCVFKGIVI